jgi:hypothetical protein
MISLLRKARPRRSPSRVRLVELDGTPVVQPTADFALSWPATADDWFWEATDHVVGVDSMGADVHASDCPEPDETDAEWLARLEAQDEEDKARVLATYQPSPTDLAEYQAWSEGLDSDALPASMADHFRLGEHSADEYDAISRGQVTSDELSMLASHGCI